MSFRAARINCPKHRPRRRLDRDPPSPALPPDEADDDSDAVDFDDLRLALVEPVDALAGPARLVWIAAVVRGWQLQTHDRTSHSQQE